MGGGVDGLFGAITGAFRARNDRKAAGNALKATKEQRDASNKLVSELDYEPTLASEHIAPYQRSRSPVADSFLDSFLTGDNAAAISSTRAGAPRQKFEAQQRFDKNYGGWDALRAEQAELQKSTPWQVKPFDKPIMTDEQRETIKAPGLKPLGLTTADADALAKVGLSPDYGNGKQTNSWAALMIERRYKPEELPGVYRAIADAVLAGDIGRAKDIRNGVVRV